MNAKEEILKILEEYGPITSGDLSQKVSFGTTKLYRELRELKEEKAIRRITNLLDVRKTYYALNGEIND